MTNSIYTDQGQSSSMLNEDYTNDKIASVAEEEVSVSVLDAGYLSSIELKREKIRKEYATLFKFTDRTREVDFISTNNDLIDILPSIGEFFKKEVSKGSMMSLELMEEENDWKTLFINIRINDDADWSGINQIVDSFYDNMFDLFPTVMEKLNIDLVSHEF
ncbi:hypothetical protein [Ekhidna sp. To15]|uniref:hypothetical protein n=1 Tax=Ekhidna sp. To15 TaxID=3395267 RepID=UPI003F51D618